MKAFLILLLLFGITSLNAQFLLNPKGRVLEDLPFFNPDFIRKHKIKSFRGNYATKYNRDVIRPNKDVFVYEFDRIGQLVRKYKIHLNDTLISNYQYDYKGNVVLHRESNKYGYYEYRYEYDKRNRLLRMEIRRDKESSYNKLSFELDESTIIAVETYEYKSLEDSDYKRICYNKAGRVYKKEFFYFNNINKLAKKNLLYTMVKIGLKRTITIVKKDDLKKLRQFINRLTLRLNVKFLVMTKAVMFCQEKFMMEINC